MFGFCLDIVLIVKGCGYVYVLIVFDKEGFLCVFEKLFGLFGLVFFEIKVWIDLCDDLGCFMIILVENKEYFMVFLKDMYL